MKLLFIFDSLDQAKSQADAGSFCGWILLKFGIDVQPDIRFLSFSDQTFTPHDPGTTTTDVLSTDWVRQNIFPLVSDSFACFYVFNSNLMPRPSSIGGEMLGKMGNTWMCPVAGGIDEVLIAGAVRDNAIVHRLEHEFLHICEYVTGQYNIVHQYDGTAFVGLDLDDPVRILHDPFLKALVGPVSPVPVNPQVSLLQGIIAFLKGLLARKSLISAWAQGIKMAEGYFPGSASYQNKNGGNLKYGNYTISLGAIGRSPAGFAIFPSEAVGDAALERLLSDAVSGKLIPTYRPTESLIEFTMTYTTLKPGTELDNYLKTVCARLNQLPPTTPISSLA